MRTRATVAILSGTLALSAFAVPAAHADTSSAGDTKITKVVVNGGKPVILGTTTSKSVTVAVTATDDSGIANVYAMAYHETGGKVDGIAGSGDVSSCTASNATTYTCTVTVPFETADKDILTGNSAAGTWKIYADALAKDNDNAEKDNAGTVKVLRQSRLTVNAAPEPVKKGKTITVTGALTRANWETHKYAGYTNQPVKLQFRKKGSSTYTTVKTVKSGAKGALKTTVKASVDGFWRWNFAGTATTSALTTAGDFVDVK
ncbi:DUF5707 domain-containing protein [Actinacidiphila soli]|uniref:DUF5707 domain-containing protein n=1 Tax=Actinacidiphila soli TaxID=2487275 RepID=UPI000FCC9DC4|nr:DUF5707 domain-containing protein [Actinacidiphila soli]